MKKLLIGFIVLSSNIFGIEIQECRGSSRYAYFSGAEKYVCVETDRRGTSVYRLHPHSDYLSACVGGRIDYINMAPYCCRTVSNFGEKCMLIHPRLRQ